jgi:hypothetical protein
VVAEHEDTQEGGGGDLEVQPKGDGRRLREAKTEEQEHRPQDPTSYDGSKQPEPIGSVGPPGKADSAAPEGRRRDSEGRPQVQQPS